MKCKCSWCKISKRLKKIRDKLNKSDAKFLEDFVGLYLDESTEMSRLKAMMQGKWPQSEVIHRAYVKWQEDRFKELKMK